MELGFSLGLPMESVKFPLGMDWFFWAKEKASGRGTRGGSFRVRNKCFHFCLFRRVLFLCCFSLDRMCVFSLQGVCVFLTRRVCILMKRCVC